MGTRGGAISSRPCRDLQWLEANPEALYWGLRFMNRHYRLPVVVTENGMANADAPAWTGRSMTRRALIF